MKKLGIDARLYRQTGVGVYIRNLLINLEKEISKDIQVYIYLTTRDFDSVEFTSKQFIKRKADFLWHGFKEQTTFLKTLFADKLDLMHFTYFSYPILYRRDFISTIHDLTPYLFKTGRASTKGPLFYALKYYFFVRVLKAQIKNAKAIITPTKAVKKEILTHFGNQFEKKIFPIYEGVNEEIKHTKESRELKKKFTKDFFVYIGNFYPHKNVSKLIGGFAKVTEDVTLVLAGPDDFFAKGLTDRIHELDQEKRVVLFKNPTLSDLVFFYKHAKGLINPSLSEGFGLPILEAAYFNCPVLGSNIEVFQEVLERRYSSFNPYYESDITRTISSVIKNPPHFNNSSLLEKYSFEKMTKETAELYKTYLNR